MSGSYWRFCSRTLPACLFGAGATNRAATKFACSLPDRWPTFPQIFPRTVTVGPGPLGLWFREGCARSAAFCAPTPRRFVGQIPTDKTEEDLIPLFSPFGEIEKLTLVCTPEGKSRGCAMVQFRRWSDAERAAAAINGTTTMEGGRGRALVVHFANPRRLVGSGAAEPAITPRKLFVGQIPKAATEADVAAVFAPFGEIQQINILKSKGIHAGCAFVQLASWAACEAAIDALHEQRVLPGCEHPLVVKFADAKRPDNLAAKQHRSISLLGLNGMLGPGGMLANHAYISGELGHMPLPPHMPLGNPLTGAREG